MSDDSTTQRPGDAGSLAAGIMDLEEERLADEAERDKLADDVLPGVGDAQLSLKEALTVGGTSTFVILALIAAVDNIEGATLGTLAPDIRESLGISDGALVFISAASASFIILGAMPFGWMADRFKRSRVIGWASTFFAAMVLLSGMAANALTLFLTRLGAGISKSNQYTVHGSVLADTYPIQSRGRVGASLTLAAGVTGALSPLIVGGIAAVAGGIDGWRWAYLLLSIPCFIVAFVAFKVPNPPRGQWEKKGIVGDVMEDANPAPISMEAAFARLLQIKTLKTVMVAFSALGFGMFTVPILGSLFLEREHGLGSFGRGVLGTVGGAFVLLAAPFVGKYYDRTYREDPAKALRVVSRLILPTGLIIPIALFMPNPVLYACFAIPNSVLMMSAYAMVGPIGAGIIPYRLRGMGAALMSLYVFFIGATGGALLSGMLSNMYGPRTAILVIYTPSALVGGYMILRGSKFIIGDLALVTAEIREEHDEHERMKADPENIPALQVHHIDFFYDTVQILFDVGFEVRKGEVLALLGTNGAGKSTILRVIAGLGTPARGVVRQNGRAITYVSPEVRTRLGIRMLPGGKGVFHEMTVHDNLEVAAYNYRVDPADAKRRIEGVYELLPELEEKKKRLASELSGGQQQLLALGRVLIADPEILIIDELSLGLAPIMVERLVEVVRALRDKGLTIIVVEQSLNVAASIADTAVFLEKGSVRFTGPIAELMERNDLARAVFLGKEGG